MTAMKEECGLCGRVLPHYSLRRCYRCRKLYCRSCMIADFTSEDRNLICLNCARRTVSPEKTVTKYTPLNRYLIRRAEYADQVTLSFARIEGIIGDNLPLGAVRNRSWWSNTESNVQGQAWMNASWRVEDVNLQERIVTFKNAKGKARETGKKAGRTREDIKPFIPPPVRTRIRRKPSKTRISLIQAKFKNVERQRSSIRSYRGKFKPKPAHEKRLYKPEAKPSKQDT
jgi:hypothetical protein